MMHGVDDRFPKRPRLETRKVLLQLGALGRELSPIEIDGTVVIAEDRRIELPADGQLAGVRIRALRRLGLGHALGMALVRRAVEKPPFAVEKDAVRRVKARLRGNSPADARPPKHGLGVNPTRQVGRRQDVVLRTAVILRAFVVRTEDPQHAVRPHAPRRIGQKLPLGGDGIGRNVRLFDCSIVRLFDRTEPRLVDWKLGIDT